MNTSLRQYAQDLANCRANRYQAEVRIRALERALSDLISRCPACRGTGRTGSVACPECGAAHEALDDKG